MRYLTSVILLLALMGAAVASDNRLFILHSDSFEEVGVNETSREYYLMNNVTLSTSYSYKTLTYQSVGGQDHVILTGNDSTDGYIFDYVKNSEWTKEKQVKLTGITNVWQAVRDQTGYYYYTVEQDVSFGTGETVTVTSVLYKTLTGTTVSSTSFNTLKCEQDGSGSSTSKVYNLVNLYSDSEGTFFTVSPEIHEESGTSYTCSSPTGYIRVLKLRESGSYDVLKQDSLSPSVSPGKGRRYYKTVIDAGHGLYSVYDNVGAAYRKLYDCEYNGTNFTSCTSYDLNAYSGVAAYFNHDPQEYDYAYNSTQVRGSRYFTGYGTETLYYNTSTITYLDTETGYVTGESTETQSHNVTVRAVEGTSECGSLGTVDGVTCTLESDTVTTSGGSQAMINMTTPVTLGEVTYDVNVLHDSRTHYINNYGTDQPIYLIYRQGAIKTESGDVLNDKIILQGYIFLPYPDNTQNITSVLYHLWHYEDNAFLDDDTYTDEVWVGYNSTHYLNEHVKFQDGSMTGIGGGYTDSFPYDMRGVFWEYGGAPWNSDPDLVYNSTDDRPMLVIPSYKWVRLFIWRQINVTKLDSSGTDDNKLTWKLYDGLMNYTAGTVVNYSSASATAAEGVNTLYCVAPSGYVFSETGGPTLSKQVTVSHDGQVIDVMLEHVKQADMIVHLSTNNYPSLAGASVVANAGNDSYAFVGDGEGNYYAYNLPVNTDFQVHVNPRLQGYDTYTMTLSTGDYYNSEGYGDGVKCTSDDPVTYKYNINLDFQGGLKLHILPYTYSEGEKYFVPDVKVCVGSACALTGSTGEAVLEQNYSTVFEVSFYSERFGLNYSVNLTKNDFRNRYRSGDWYAEVQVPVTAMPQEIMLPAEDQEAKIKSGDQVGFLLGLVNLPVVWGMLFVAVGAVSMAVVTKDGMTTAVGALIGLGVSVGLGLMPLYVVIVMGVLFAGVIALMFKGVGVGGV